MADEHYISGEEYQKIQSRSSNNGKKVTIPKNAAAAVIVVVVLCGLSFAGGMAYQKKHQPKPAASPAGAGFGGQGGSSRRGGAGLGQVTAVSATSITVTNQRTNASKTYAITGSTAISDNGQTVAASDIKSGDTVLIATGNSDTGTATRILVNPSFGGGFGGSQNAPDATQSTQ